MKNTAFVCLKKGVSLVLADLFRQSFLLDINLVLLDFSHAEIIMILCDR